MKAKTKAGKGYNPVAAVFARIAFEAMTDLQIASVLERWELRCQQRGWTEDEGWIAEPRVGAIERILRKAAIASEM